MPLGQEIRIDITGRVQVTLLFLQVTISILQVTQRCIEVSVQKIYSNVKRGAERNEGSNQSRTFEKIF